MFSDEGDDSSGDEDERGRKWPIRPIACLTVVIITSFLAFAIYANLEQPASNAVPLYSPSPKISEKCSPEVTGTAQGKANCEYVCKKAECCMFAPSESESCLEGNEEACDQYNIYCNVYSVNNHPFNSIAVPPAPWNMKTDCSTTNILVEEGRRECEESCLPGKCCSAPPEENCRETNPNCAGYEICSNLQNIGNQTILNSTQVDEACSYITLYTQGNSQCEQICSQAACCFSSECDVPPTFNCEMYKSCFNYVKAESDKKILPAWATIEEKETSKEEPEDNEYEIFDANGERERQPEKEDSTMPDSFRIPAEFEGTSAVMMTYDAFKDILDSISVTVAEAGAEVWIVGGPKKTPKGVPDEMYKRFDFDYDSAWSRDYGPIGIDDGSGELGIIDHTYSLFKSRKADNKIPRKLAKVAQKNSTRSLGELEIENYYYTSLRLDGGNIMLDGKGNLFMTDVTYEWNPKLSKEEVDDKLLNMFGVETIHALPFPKASSSHPYYVEGENFPADGTGHIDMYAKILGDCQVLVSQTEGNSDSEDPFHEVLEDIANYFENLECGSGTYQVTRIPAWYDDWNSIWYTYTNSLIVNSHAIIPGYDKLDDDLAISIYEQMMPNHKVVSYNTDESIKHGGSIHCLTRDIPIIN